MLWCAIAVKGVKTRCMHKHSRALPASYYTQEQQNCHRERQVVSANVCLTFTTIRWLLHSNCLPRNGCETESHIRDFAISHPCSGWLCYLPPLTGAPLQDTCSTKVNPSTPASASFPPHQSILQSLLPISHTLPPQAAGTTTAPRP